MFYVYCLREKGGNRTYVGYTVNPENRIRQHNGEKTGGAKATRGREWEFAFIISGFETSQNALQCEWRLKHPFGINKKGKYRGILGRLEGLEHCMKDEYWTNQSVISNADCSYTIHFEEKTYAQFNNLGGTSGCFKNNDDNTNEMKNMKNWKILCLGGRLVVPL